MRRCHFLGPHFFFRPPSAGSQILCCASSAFILCPRTSRQCEGERSWPHAESSDGRLLSHRIKHLFNRPVDVAAGSAPRREWPRFCVGVCLGSGPTPREARAATPEEAGPRRRLRLVISRPPPPPSSVRLHRGARPLHPESSTPAAAAREPLWPSSHPTPPSACFPAFSFFLVNSILAGHLATLRLKTERKKKRTKSMHPPRSSRVCEGS